MRRRRTPEASASTETGNPMDEDDQAEVVASLEKEGLQQIETFNRIFSIICFVAMGSTAVVVLIHGGGLLQWAHAIYSASVYWIARLYAAAEVSGSLKYSGNVALLVLSVLSPFLLMTAYNTSLTENDTAHLHWSIALANLLIVVCSILLRIETINTVKGINTLESSKYSFKSL